MRTRIIDFKKSVYELYGKHIAELKDLSVNEIEDIVLPNEDALIAGIFTDVKGRIEEETERRKNARELKNEEPPYSDIAEDDSNAQEIATAVAGASPELSPEAQEAEDEYLKYMMGESEEEEESEE